MCWRPAQTVRVTHPALDLPLYGLDGSWSGRRWLEFLEGESGQPVCAVWLAHRGDALTDPWVLVASLPEPRHSDAMTSPGGDAMRELAFAAAFGVVNWTSPCELLSSGDRELYRHNVVRVCDELADRWRDWPTFTWTIGGRSVSARVLAWAGAWAGFTEVAGAPIVVVGAGRPPEGLRLVQVDPQAYFFDGSAALDYPGVLERSVEQADGTRPVPGHWLVHADHTRLLGPRA